MQYTFSNKDKVYSKSLGWVSRINTSAAPNQGVHTKNRGNNSILFTEGSMPLKSGSADNDASFAMGRKDFVKTVLSSSPMTMNNTDQSSYLARRKAIATGKIIRSAPISFSSKERNTVITSLRKARNKGYVVPKNVTYSRMRKAEDNGFGEIQELWTNTELTSFTLLDGFLQQLQMKGDLISSSYSGGIIGGADNIASVNIGTKVTTIGQGAFQDLKKLRDVSIPSTVTTIGQSAFDSCTKLTSITIPAGVTTLGQWVFYHCTGLTAVTFEEDSQISTISGSAFEGCTSLSSITIPSSVTSFGASSFSGSGLVSITIPASVTSIAEYALSNCTSLTGVIFEAVSSLSSIESSVFEKCTALESITIPASATSIGENAFSDCTSLTKVIFDAGSSLSSIGSGVFAQCTALKDIVFNSSTIPSTMSSSTFPTISQGITAYYTQSSLSQTDIGTLKSIFGDEYVKYNPLQALSNSLGATYQVGDTITLHTLDSGFDTELGLFDENGNHVTSNDDAGGFASKGESKIEITLNSVGKYYLVVGGYDIQFEHHNFGITIGHTTQFGNGTLSYGRSGEQLSTIPFTIDSANKYRVYTFDIVAA